MLSKWWISPKRRAKSAAMKEKRNLVRQIESTKSTPSQRLEQCSKRERGDVDTPDQSASDSENHYFSNEDLLYDKPISVENHFVKHCNYYVLVLNRDWSACT